MMRNSRGQTSRIAITGAAGFLGRSLQGALVEEDSASLVLIDRSFGGNRDRSAENSIEVEADLSSPDWLRAVEEFKPDVVFHLAASVSAETEENPATGYQVNVESTRALVRCLERAEKPATIVFASSIAAYPPSASIATVNLPASSYGVQKLIAEAILADSVRRGKIKGISLRLPTVMVRPGAPNRAASSFLSDIVREPLSGRMATLPVPLDTEVWVTSPRHVVGSLMHAVGVAQKHAYRFPLPCLGRRVKISEILETLKRIWGGDVEKYVELKPDPRIQDIVCRWPPEVECGESIQFGFPSAPTIADIIVEYLQRTEASAQREKVQ